APRDCASHVGGCLSWVCCAYQCPLRGSLLILRVRPMGVRYEPSQYILWLPAKQQPYLLLERRAVAARPLALNPVLQAPGRQREQMEIVRRRVLPRFPKPLVHCQAEHVFVLGPDHALPRLLAQPVREGEPCEP